MNFGFLEIVGEVLGLLAICVFHRDCRINVEIMKARDWRDIPSVRRNSIWIPYEDYGSPSLCFPYETRQSMRCIPRGHSLLEIVEDQLFKQHDFIRKVSKSWYKLSFILKDYFPYHIIQGPYQGPFHIIRELITIFIQI